MKEIKKETIKVCEKNKIVSKCETTRKEIKIMNCNCNIFTPISITESEGITKITLDSNSLSMLCDNQAFGINLSVSNPVVSTCNSIIVTDGEVIKDVFKNNQYYRKDRLPCGCIMWLCNKSDPSSVVVFCRYTPNNRGCR